MKQERFFLFDSSSHEQLYNAGVRRSIPRTASTGTVNTKSNLVSFRTVCTHILHVYIYTIKRNGLSIPSYQILIFFVHPSICIFVIIAENRGHLELQHYTSCCRENSDLNHQNSYHDEVNLLRLLLLCHYNECAA